jgi:GNAT superfamily N-acetyltransferase
MEFQVLPAWSECEPVLWDMLYLAVFVPPGTVPLPSEIVHRPELARYVTGWGRAGDMGMIASAPLGGQTLGAAWLRRWSDDDRGYGYVDPVTPELCMAVIPAARGQGVGTALLNRLLWRADNQFDAVSLSVSLENPAVNLYRRFGFEVVERIGSSLTMKRARKTST